MYHVPRRRIARLPLILALLLPTLCSQAAEPGVHPSPDAVQPLGPGDRVPQATIRRVDGETLDLASLVADRGALLVFYRGGW